MVKIYKVAHRRLRTGISQTETETDTKSNNTTQHNTTRLIVKFQWNCIQCTCMYSVALSCCTTLQSAITLALALYMCHYKTVSVYTVSLPFPVQTPGFLCKYSAVLVPLWWSELQIQSAWCKRTKYVRHRRYATYCTIFSAKQLVKSPWSARFTGVLSKSPNKGAALKKVSHSNSSARQSSNTIPVTPNVTCKSAVSCF